MSRIPFARTTTSVAGITALALLAGCASPADDSENTASGIAENTAHSITESLPVPTGPVEELQWALYAEPASLDPIFSNDFPPMEVLANVCESLARITPDFTIEPALAVSWSQPDDLTLVYQLRDDVVFHSGAPMTAEDVAFSLARNIDPDIGSFNAGSYSAVAGVEATGEHEVTITLSEPSTTLAQTLATPVGRIVSKASVEAGGESYGTPSANVDCTGPYQMGEWKAGESIVIERFDGYWNDEFPMLVDSVIFSFVREASTRVSAMLSGQVQGSWGVPASGYGQLSSSSEGTLAFGRTSGSYVAMVTNLDGALADPRIRLAITAALDTDGIISAALDGAAEPLYAPASPGTWGFSQPIFEKAYDEIVASALTPEQAAEAVSEAGVPSETLTIAVTSSQEEMTIVGAEFQRAAQSLGLDATLVTLPGDRYNALYSDAEAREGIDIIFSLWQTRFPDPTQIYNYMKSDAFYNLAGWASPEFDSLLARAEATEDEDARAELLVEAQAITVADPIWLPIYTPYNSVFLGSGLTGAPTSSVQLSFPWAAMIGAA